MKLQEAQTQESVPTFNSSVKDKEFPGFDMDMDAISGDPYQPSEDFQLTTMSTNSCCSPKVFESFDCVANEGLDTEVEFVEVIEDTQSLEEKPATVSAFSRVKVLIESYENAIQSTRNEVRQSPQEILGSLYHSKIFPLRAVDVNAKKKKTIEERQEIVTESMEPLIELNDLTRLVAMSVPASEQVSLKEIVGAASDVIQEINKLIANDSNELQPDWMLSSRPLQTLLSRLNYKKKNENVCKSTVSTRSSNRLGSNNKVNTTKKRSIGPSAQLDNYQGTYIDSLCYKAVNGTCCARIQLVLL